MKKLSIVISIITIMTILILSGCTKKEVPQASPVEDNSNHVIETVENANSDQSLEVSKADPNEDIYDPDKEYVVFEEYNMKLIKDPSSKDGLAFLRNNIKYLSVEKADEAILKFVDHQTDSQGYYINLISSKDIQKNINSAYNYETKGFDSDLYKDLESKDLIIEIVDSGYKFYPDEGMYYPIIDYNILKEFFPNLSDELISYINILSRDSDTPASLDSTIEVTLDEIVYRILLSEDHIVNYPNGKTFSTIYDMYKMYNSFYVVNMAYTEGFDFENKVINPSLKFSYENFIKDNPNSNSAKLIKEYYDLLEKTDFKLVDESLNFIHNFDESISQKVSESQSK